MNKFYHSVYLDSDKCTGCITCLKRCPTQAIRVKKGKAHIISEFCIDCGECIRRCPHHAKKSRRDQLVQLFGKYKYLVALPAPSLYAQFNNITDPNIVLTAILLSGFDDVFEVGAAAELVSEATRKYIHAHPEKRPIISTACPTIERLIRVRFPSLIDHMLPILPPVEVAAILARERAVRKTGLAPEEIKIVFIAPCPSKIAFMHAPLGMEKSNVDATIATKDIYSLLLSHMKEAGKNPMQLNHSGKIGKNWAVSGGESSALAKGKILYADGIENVIRVLEDLEDEKFALPLEFVELNSCNAGCLGGVLNVENEYVARTKMKQLTNFAPIVLSHCSDYEDYTDTSFPWTEEVKYEPVYSLGDNIFESLNNMQEIDRILDCLPGLDCGSCGSPTCRALATDIVQRPDDANVEDCIHIMHDMYKTMVENMEADKMKEDK